MLHYIECVTILFLQQAVFWRAGTRNCDASNCYPSNHIYLHFLLNICKTLDLMSSTHLTENISITHRQLWIYDGTHEDTNFYAEIKHNLQAWLWNTMATSLHMLSLVEFIWEEREEIHSSQPTHFFSLQFLFSGGISHCFKFVITNYFSSRTKGVQTLISKCTKDFTKDFFTESFTYRNWVTSYKMHSKGETVEKTK